MILVLICFPLFSVQLHRVEGAALLRELQEPGVHRGGPGEAADEDHQQPGRLGRPPLIQPLQLGPTPCTQAQRIYMKQKTMQKSLTSSNGFTVVQCTAVPYCTPYLLYV
jgi:hypothetical protein